VVFSHPQTVTTQTAAVRNETAYGSLFLEPDLPVGTDDGTDSDFDEPEFVEPTREVNRPRRNQTGRNDARRTNRRRTAA
jgi:hypothetical protein